MSEYERIKKKDPALMAEAEAELERETEEWFLREVERRAGASREEILRECRQDRSLAIWRLRRILGEERS